MPACIITQTSTGATSVLISVLFKNEQVSFQQMTVDDLDLNTKKGETFPPFYDSLMFYVPQIFSTSPQTYDFQNMFYKSKINSIGLFCVCMGIGSVLERCECK